MTSINGSQTQPPPRFLNRIVAVERHEIAALFASFIMFFALLAAYYIVRPLRDEMGVSYGKGELHHLFTVVFFVMLAAVPVFGFVASKLPRRLVLPAIYAFFVACMLSFWLTFKTYGTPPHLAGTFFVWGSVFNLFVISLFWSLMSELWSNSEAKRLYGFIAAGGTAGAVAGPLITKQLIATLAPVDLLPVSAALLVVALIMSLALRKLRPGAADHETEPAGGGILDGAAKVIASPYFGRIALFILLANVVGTFFYLEQARLAADAFATSAERVDFFTSRDLIVSVATLTIEVFGTAAVMRYLGLTVALTALPVMATIGTLAITYQPLLWVVAAVMVGERVIAFSLSSPAIKVMYTLAAPDEKYKVQSFVDTVVYRGGDAAAGWVFALIGGSLGFAATAVPLVALPLTAIWFWNARELGSAYEAKVQEGAGKAQGL